MVKHVLLTGATGNLGQAVLNQFLACPDPFNLTLLVQPDARSALLARRYRRNKRIRILSGDIRDPDLAARAVEGVDIVLHLAALVSPAADLKPDLAMSVNVGGTENLIEAIRHSPRRDDIRFVYIGSVAETGDRMPPLHWGRVGDPIKPSVLDHYAVSKVRAERSVIDSGLKYWVSLRMTGITYYRIVNIADPIMYHQPLNNCLEWITAHDAGLMLLHLCQYDLPDAFWCDIYNVGGGPGCRLSGYQYMRKIYRALGVRRINKVMEPNWFALRNFHGQYYLDSDVLEQYLHFQTESIDQFVRKLRMRLSFKTWLIRFTPLPVIRAALLKLAHARNGPLHWVDNQMEEPVHAFFGSWEQYQRIPGWRVFPLLLNSADLPPVILDHGYDESKPPESLDLPDMQSAAIFRGGSCLSDSMEKGNLTVPLKWRCAFGHAFQMSPRAVLKGGHWCPTCEAPPWRYEAIAERNPFFAQVWPGE